VEGGDARVALWIAAAGGRSRLEDGPTFVSCSRATFSEDVRVDDHNQRESGGG
jgi:hypothetical protein